MKDTRQKQPTQGENRNYARYLADRCYQQLKPLLEQLNAEIDRRLVRTMLALVIVIVMHRHRHHGLLLSELGGYLLSPAQAPAGTKRIHNLLHSSKWCAEMVEAHFWNQADQRVAELQRQGEYPLIIWDESVIEKAESLHLEGLCPVRSMKARRLKRIKPGYFNPPGGRPIFVPGFHWLQVLVLGMKGPPRLATMRWWTTRGEEATKRRTVEQEMLAKITARWGTDVLHVWDRGFAGQPWLNLAFVHAVRFVMRWPKNYKLVDEQGRTRKPWEISRGKRSWDHRYLWDARRRCQRKVGVVAFPVFDRHHQRPLWLVIARRGQGQTPWYLVTSQPVWKPEQAWQIVLAYARRWQVEMALRFHKSELAFESPRVRRRETRARFLWIAALAYAFLLSLLDADPVNVTPWLLRWWCHRTGERSRSSKAPLYRLRLAISRLWLTHPPPPLSQI